MPLPASIPTTTGTDTTGDFCSTHSCITNFREGKGYIVQCNDGTWSHSGGDRGACSDHQGESNNCADESGNTIPCPQTTTPTENAPSPTSQSVPGNDQSAPPAANTSPPPTTTPQPGTPATRPPPAPTPTSQPPSTNFPPLVAVPNVLGDNPAQATSALQSAGFTVRQTTMTVADQSQDGIVDVQDPAAGSEPRGSTVTITVGHFQPPPSG